MKITRILNTLFTSLLTGALLVACSQPQQGSGSAWGGLSPQEARQIAKEAFI